MPPTLPPVPTAYRTSSASLITTHIPPVPQTPIFQTFAPQTPVPQPIPQQAPSKLSTNKVRLIYTKSGFYLKSKNPMEPDNSIHGFLSIFSKSMDDVDILLAWIPEYLIEPEDIPIFIQLDGELASEQGFPSVELNLGERETMTIAMKNVYSLYICPPTHASQGSVVITSRLGDVLQPIWHTPSQENAQLDMETWPGYDIIDIISAFNPLQR